MWFGWDSGLKRQQTHYYTQSTHSYPNGSTFCRRAQPLSNREALTFHKAERSHDFQSSIAVAFEAAEFRKTLYYSAHGEDWGLYTESLGKEIGG